MPSELTELRALIEQLARENQDLRRDVDDLRRLAGNLPVRFRAGGGGSLPSGGKRYQVLMKLDLAGTIGWDWPRLH